MIDQLSSLIALQREHQMRAVRAGLEALLTRQQRGIVLADEVGCGKTFEALGLAALLWRHHETNGQPLRRILIVAPTPGLITKWFDEIEAQPDPLVRAAGDNRGFQQYVQGDSWKGFQSMLRGVTALRGANDGQIPSVIEAGKRQVAPNRIYIANHRFLADKFETTPTLKWLGQTDWDLIIVDEAHNFAGLHKKMARVFFPEQTAESRPDGLVGRYVLALTATPFQLKPKELLNLLRIALAHDDDLDTLSQALPRFERALEQFYTRRALPPDDPSRRACVDRLERLRTVDAVDGQKAYAVGLEPLLRKYLIRNVKDPGQRAYRITDRTSEGYAARRFEKLDDVKAMLRQRPLVPISGPHALLYLELRDLILDTFRATSEDQAAKPTFVSGDLRQGLSSYEQLEASSLVQDKPDLPRAARVREMVKSLRDSGAQHPKVEALAQVVDEIVARELEALEDDETRTRMPAKILVFNTLLKTAQALKVSLEGVVAKRVDAYVDRELAAAGFTDRQHAKNMVREALELERQDAEDKVLAHLGPRRELMHVDRELLRGVVEMKAESRSLVDIMYDRAGDHCTQALFLLRLARWLRVQEDPPSEDNVLVFVSQRVGKRLTKSIFTIVDDYLDDTPAQGVARSDENRIRARREITRLVRILSIPDYVARFDGDTDTEERDKRRECFNRPYAPLVLLASRVGEEGIDLQKHTRYVLHYDVEWNPAKMEQREGRVDREGNEAKKVTAAALALDRDAGAVKVQFFLLKDTYEERIFHTVMQRDAWFQILIGSKRQELGKVDDDDPDDVLESIDETEAERSGHLTVMERDRVMLNLRP